MVFNLNKGLLVAGAAALSILAWSAGPAAASSSGAGSYCSSQSTGTFYNQSLCAYAWQSVAAGGGNLPTTGNYVTLPAGPTYVSPSLTKTGSFLIDFTVPGGAGGGYTFQQPQTIYAITSGSCASSGNVPDSANSTPTDLQFTIVVTGTGPCTVELGPTTIEGAAALATPNYSCLIGPHSDPNSLNGCANSPPDSVSVCETVSASGSLGISQTGSPCALSIVYAEASSQLGFTTDGINCHDGEGPADCYDAYENYYGLIINIGAVDAEKLCLGTGWTYGQISPSNYDPTLEGYCNTTADIGSLDVWTNDYSEADSEAPYVFPSGNMTIDVYGNYAGIADGFLTSGPDCTGTKITTAIPSGNDLKFTVPVPSSYDTTVSYEFCLDSNAGQPGKAPVIGANFNGFGGPALPNSSAPNTPPGGNGGSYSNTSSPLITLPSSPTPTYQNALGNALTAYGYNGILQPINSSWAGNSAVDPYIRVVNNTAEPIQVFADVQGDYGSLGTAVVESNLPGNTNDYVSVSAIAAAAGVTPGVGGRLSLVLAVPYPAVANPPEGSTGSTNTVYAGTGSQGACIPNTVSNANGAFGSINGLCFVGIEQVVGEQGDSIWVNMQ